LQWVDDPKRRQVALDAALPRTLNRDIIAVLHGEESADELFNWLKQMPFVEDRSNGWVYHDIARTQMLRHKRLVSPQSWADLHGKLATYYDTLLKALQLDEREKWRSLTWQIYSLNSFYHYFCQLPQRDMTETLKKFLIALKNQPNLAQQWAETLIQSGKDGEANGLQDRGVQLVEGLKAYNNACYEVAVDMFTSLLKQFELEPEGRAVCLAWRGEAHRLMECYELALKDFGCAIELDPNYAWVIARRGGTYKQLAQFEDALKALNRAIELDPNQAWIITRRGVIYRSMGRLNNAFEDFNRAIKLDPNFGLAVYNRGEMYLLQRQFKEALIDFNRAIELNNTNDWCLYLRGLTYQALDQKDHSESDFELAIDFAKHKYNNDPENCNNIFNLATYCVAANKIEQAKHFYSDGLHRGAPHRQIQEAIQDLDYLLKIFPNHRSAKQIREVLLKRIGNSQ